MKHLTIDTAPQANRSIELTASRMALESAFLADFSNMLEATIPNLVSNLSTSFSNSFKNVTNFVSSFTPENRLDSKISQIPYSELANIRAYVPEGFSGNAFEYTKVLQESLDHANKVISDVLNPYNTYISELLSSIDATKSTQGKPQFLVKMDKDRDTLNAEVGKFFKNSTITSDKVSKFYHNSNEVINVKTKVNALVAQLESSNVLLVQKNTRDTLELLNALTKSNKAEELNSISPETIKALAESTLTVAREVEFYAITRYRAEAFIKCFQDTLEILKTLK